MKKIKLVCSLGHPVERKNITIERLSKGGYVILGTPQLTFQELNEFLGVLFHELHVRGF